MMGDANIRLPETARDRLAEVAAAQGLSLRAYLTRLAAEVATPAELAEQAERARTVLREWNGYDPSAPDAVAAKAELNRRLRALQFPADDPAV